MAKLLLVCTPYAHSKWEIKALEGIRDIAFNSERSIDQGDIHTPFPLLAVFDVPLTVFDHPPKSDHFFSRSAATTPTNHYSTRPICYADDLLSLPRPCRGSRTPLTWSHFVRHGFQSHYCGQQTPSLSLLRVSPFLQMILKYSGSTPRGSVPTWP